MVGVSPYSHVDEAEPPQVIQITLVQLQGFLSRDAAFIASDENAVTIDDVDLGTAVLAVAYHAVTAVYPQVVNAGFDQLGLTVIAEYPHECRLIPQFLGEGREIQGVATGIHDVLVDVLINNLVSQADDPCALVRNMTRHISTPPCPYTSARPGHGCGPWTGHSGTC